MRTCGALALATVLLALSSGARAATPEGAGGDANAMIERKLDRKVSFEFVSTPMSEVLQFLQVLTRANVMADPRIPKKKRMVPVTLKVTDLLLRDALERVLTPIGLEFSVRMGVLFISERGAPDREGGSPELSKSLEARLARKVSFEFAETPLSEVVRLIERLGGVTIELPDSVAERRGATPITLKVTNVRAGLAIEWILQLADLGYEQRGEGLVCVLARAAEESPRVWKPAFPTVMVVVDCARAADRRAARDLLAYLTRDRLPDGDISRSTFGSFKLLPAANIAAARRAAAKAGAFGILRVVIAKRVPEARMRGSYLISTTCALYTLAKSRAKAKPKWKLKATRRIANASLRSGPGLVITSSDDFDKPGDPMDFRRITGDIASLVQGAAVGLKGPRLAKAPGGGFGLEVEVTNNTRHAITRLTVSLGGKDMAMCDYSGDPIPPGTKKVTITVPEAEARRLRRGDLAPKVISSVFGEAGRGEASP